MSADLMKPSLTVGIVGAGPGAPPAMSGVHDDAVATLDTLSR
jgi:hypothetical protein